MPDVLLKRMLRLTGAFVVVSLFFATAARAESVIIGTVSSAETNEPLQDVVVTATGPNVQGERFAVTDAQGRFRIPDLPAGVYTLHFYKESFKPFSRTDIPLRPDRTVRVTVKLPVMLPEDFPLGCGGLP